MRRCLRTDQAGGWDEPRSNLPVSAAVWQEVEYHPSFQNLFLRDASCYLGEIGKLHLQRQGSSFETAFGDALQQFEYSMVQFDNHSRFR